MKHFAGVVIDSIGGLLLVVGLIVSGYHIVGSVRTHQVVATVVAVQPLCQIEVCSTRRCQWRKINCESMSWREAEGSKVRAKPFAKLSFLDTQGRERQAWSSFSNLEIERAELGDRIPVAYQGKSRPRAIKPVPWNIIQIWFAGAMFGAFLMLLGRWISRTSEEGRVDRGGASTQD